MDGTGGISSDGWDACGTKVGDNVGGTEWL
jgi:hypothetical protein